MKFGSPATHLHPLLNLLRSAELPPDCNANGMGAHVAQALDNCHLQMFDSTQFILHEGTKPNGQSMGDCQNQYKHIHIQRSTVNAQYAHSFVSHELCRIEHL